MANKLDFITALGDSARKGTRNFLSDVMENVGAKKQKNFVNVFNKKTRNLAESKTFGNRGLDILGDITRPTVSSNALIGAGVGGLGGVIGAPGTEDENIMGKKTYKSPGLMGRLSSGLTGALMGGGLGAGLGMYNLHSLAKAVAKGEDLPAGVASRFMKNLSNDERRNLISTAATQIDPKVLNKLKNNPAKKVFKPKDWLHPQNIAQRKNAIALDLQKVIDDERNDMSYGKTVESQYRQNLLQSLFGRSNPSTISPEDIARVSANYAGADKNKFTALSKLLDPDLRTHFGGITNIAKERASRGLGEQAVDYGLLGTAAGGALGGPISAAAGAAGGGLLALGSNLIRRLQGTTDPIARKAILHELENVKFKLGKKGAAPLDVAWRNAGLAGDINNQLASIGGNRRSLMDIPLTGTNLVKATGLATALGLGGYGATNVGGAIGTGAGSLYGNLTNPSTPKLMRTHPTGVNLHKPYGPGMMQS